MTARAAAALDEAAPGLAGILARQKIIGELMGRKHAIACVVRSFVAGTSRGATEVTASRRWNKWEHELQPRYPVVEACAKALEDTLSLGATFVVRQGMVECSGLHPSVFFRRSLWNMDAFSRCSHKPAAQLHPRSGWRQIQWYSRHSRKKAVISTPSAPPAAPLPLGDALDSSASVAQREAALRFGQQVADMLLAKGSMPVRDLLDAHRAAFRLQHPVAVRKDFKN